MRHGLTRTLLAVTLLGGLAAGRCSAASEVKDTAHLFSDKALREANDILKEIESTARREVVVETYAGIPPEKQREYDRIPNEDKAAHNRFFANWAEERFRARRANGVYVLIYKPPGGKPGHVQVEAGDETRKNDFTTADLQHLRGILVEISAIAHVRR